MHPLEISRTLSVMLIGMLLTIVIHVLSFAVVIRYENYFIGHAFYHIEVSWLILISGGALGAIGGVAGSRSVVKRRVG
jgi:hypothetical protein